MKKNRTNRIRPLDDARLRQCYVNQLSSESGLIYGSDYDGNVFMIRDLQVEAYIPSTEISRPVQTVSRDPPRKGYLYIGTTGSEILHGSFSKPIDSFEVTATLA